MFDRQLPINTVNELLAAHGTRLRTLIGTTIDATWVGWDVARDEWFADEAVILKVGQARLEIVCWKLDEIVLSWSGIDLGQPPRWVADWGSEFSLEWRRDGIAALQGVVGRSIVAIQYRGVPLPYNNRTGPSKPCQRGTRAQGVASSRP